MVVSMVFGGKMEYKPVPRRRTIAPFLCNTFQVMLAGGIKGLEKISQVAEMVTSSTDDASVDGDDDEEEEEERDEEEDVEEEEEGEDKSLCSERDLAPTDEAEEVIKAVVSELRPAWNTSNIAIISLCFRKNQKCDIR